jgi:hypothetical protein
MSYKQSITQEETGLKVGEKYTILKVSEFMANTIKDEIIITGFKEGENYAQYRNVLMVCFKQRGKRTEKGFYLKDSDLFLSGWDLGIKTDSDTGKGFKGNALINLVSKNPTELFNLISDKFVYGNKGIVFYNSEEDVLKDDGKPLFLELAKEQIGEHAIIKRVLE